ncbi:MAG TPA: DNA topoisomerase IV subunit A [Casimicrobiaceae bacterium]|nr:DNA topoisomerase IV subunit A [Casimicrobiaceae bacterium]
MAITNKKRTTARSTAAPASKRAKTAPASKRAKATTANADTLSGELFDEEGTQRRSSSALSPPPPPSPPPSGASGNGEDDALPLAQFAERSYLEYAMSVVTGRALPDVADGQKPVQRRILFAMHELGLHPPTRHVKSARVVGDVLGKYHPHGDTAAYDALVRQAQDFTLRYPLIDGQGNFGSRDGDNAAAMRYTECRLTALAELLLAEIDQDTVDFIANYDGAFKEPKLLPARLPMLLLNGASGIGVGLATDIPSHNLREVARAVVATIRNPNITMDRLLKLMPGPDLPGGGHLISDADTIRAIYEGGRGSLRVRARWTVEELARGQWRVAVTELPFGVSARAVLEDIERATNPKPKEGKKSLSQEQINLKAVMLAALDTVRDESDKTAPVRIVLEPRSSRQDPQEFMHLLLANTRLEASLPINLVMLGRDGRPRSKNLKQMLEEWIAFRFETVTRRTRHRLGEVDRRIHILEGRLIALLSIDKVIRIIRKSDDPKVDLMKAFELTEIQADDILEIRLRQLARLEGIRIETELKSLKDERKGLKSVLADNKVLSDLVVSEIEADATRYGDARRTLIETVEPIVISRTVPDEPLTITLSRHGWIRSRQGHGLDATQFSYKAGDEPLAVLETRTVNPVVVLDTKGRAYTIRASDIPGGRGDGVPVTTLIDLPAGARVAQAILGAPEQKFLVAGSGGYGFIATFSDMLSRVKAGKAFMTLGDEEEPIVPVAVVAGLDHVATLSSGGRLLVFPLEEMREMERGRGVIVMGLDRDEKLLAAALTSADKVMVRGTNRLGRTIVVTLEGDELAKHKLHRARKGSLVGHRIKPTGFATAPVDGS